MKLIQIDTVFSVLTQTEIVEVQGISPDHDDHSLRIITGVEDDAEITIVRSPAGSAAFVFVWGDPA